LDFWRLARVSDESRPDATVFPLHSLLLLRMFTGQLRPPLVFEIQPGALRTSFFFLFGYSFLICTCLAGTPGKKPLHRQKMVFCTIKVATILFNTLLLLSFRYLPFCATSSHGSRYQSLACFSISVFEAVVFCFCWFLGFFWFFFFAAFFFFVFCFGCWGWVGEFCFVVCWWVFGLWLC